MDEMLRKIFISKVLSDFTHALAAIPQEDWMAFLDKCEEDCPESEFYWKKVREIVEVFNDNPINLEETTTDCPESEK